MPQRIKTVAEIATQAYLNKSDIQKLFGVSFEKAKKIYALAEKLDEELPYRIEETKVRLTSISRVYGVSVSQIRKMVQ